MLRARFLTITAILLLAISAGAQKPPKHGSKAAQSQGANVDSGLKISGQVTTPHGDFLPGAEVAVEVLGDRARHQTVSAGPHGQFEARVPKSKSASVTVTVTASMPGYAGAQETIEAEPGQAADSIGLVLRKEPVDPDLPDFESLCEMLLPRLRAPATGQPLMGVPLKHMELAVRLLDKDAPEGAAEPLAEVARQNAGCIECGTLAGLAELETGAWSSAGSDLMRASHAAATGQGKSRMPEPLLVLGELQIWRGEFSKAAVSFLGALAIQPDQPLALQELGRTFMLERRMTVADRYLDRALAHGADPESHLLKAQTLIELNEPEKAREQIEAYLGGRRPKDLDPESRQLWAMLSQRIDLELRPGSATLVDRNPAELASAAPELTELVPISDTAAMEPVLRKIGLGVQAIFEDFPNTSVQEEIEMQRLHQDGKIADSLKQHFQYLLVSSVDRDILNLDEYRVDNSGAPVTPGAPDRDLMATSGFASIPLVFHPDYQIGSSFRLLGHQEMDGHDALVIAFAERPATAKMLEEFVLKDQRTTVLTQGFAWIDPDTFQVLRMHTELLKPAPEVRLTAQTTDVRYGPVHFKSNNQTLWLPQEVTVTVHWNGRAYRNTHRYSDYQLFQVGTHEKTKAPKVPSPAPEH